MTHLATDTQVHRTGPLTRADLASLPAYLKGHAGWGMHLTQEERAALGLRRGLYHSAFARLRWPGLDYDHLPSRTDILAYLDGLSRSQAHVHHGVPCDALWKEEPLPVAWVADFYLRHTWVDPQTGESPVLRWPTWNSQGLPTDRYANNPNWHADGGNASMVYALHPMAMVELLHTRLEKIPGDRIEAVHLDNFNLPFGGNRPYEGCPLGSEFEAAYLDSVKLICHMLHGRGVVLQVNNLRADQPGWDLPWDSLQLEYGWEDFDGLRTLVAQAKGRPVFVKSRRVDTVEKAAMVALAGARLTSIWPGETRPAEWFTEGR